MVAIDGQQFLLGLPKTEEHLPHEQLKSRKDAAFVEGVPREEQALHKGTTYRFGDHPFDTGEIILMPNRQPILKLVDVQVTRDNIGNLRHVEILSNGWRTLKPGFRSPICCLARF